MQAEIKTLPYMPDSADCSPTDDHKFKRWDPFLREMIGFRLSGTKTQQKNGEDVLIQMSTRAAEKVQFCRVTTIQNPTVKTRHRFCNKLIFSST
ncbi:hypothetical protein Y032_0168g204 [Ancylostoma ceylanicum]|uniref:Uncharacterized protein n=1 Tax=Ancylostoma ceylanicum TaxID=53326 RepID=A0A016SWE7_9BILA|nr:hypothetical protein Y032_0168g204 [Ancylostoma ceylanicum]